MLRRTWAPLHSSTFECRSSNKVRLREIVKWCECGIAYRWSIRDKTDSVHYKDSPELSFHFLSISSPPSRRKGFCLTKSLNELGHCRRPVHLHRDGSMALWCAVVTELIRQELSFGFNSCDGGAVVLYIDVLMYLIQTPDYNTSVSFVFNSSALRNAIFGISLDLSPDLDMYFLRTVASIILATYPHFINLQSRNDYVKMGQTIGKAPLATPEVAHFANRESMISRVQRQPVSCEVASFRNSYQQNCLGFEIQTLVVVHLLLTDELQQLRFVFTDAIATWARNIGSRAGNAQILKSC